MQGWRHQAGRPDLPFAIVQISAYGATAAHPVESGWANMRDIQRPVAKADAHAAIAGATYLCHPPDIHPVKNHEVGQRLALRKPAPQPSHPRHPPRPHAPKLEE